MAKSTLQNIGLTNEQSAIYSALLEKGYANARSLSDSTRIKRGTVYKALDQLTALDLVEKKDERGSVAVFFPKHPKALEQLIATREERVEAEKQALESIMGQLTSQFNLTTSKPNVLFYEGEKGLEHVVEDSLYAKSEIYSYLDFETLEKHFSDINKKYAKRRERLGIKKRGLVVDSPFNRTHLAQYHTDVTDTKFITLSGEPFQTVMQIYDNKVSYLTLSEETMIGAILEDAHIASMHKQLFDHLWDITATSKITNG